VFLFALSQLPQVNWWRAVALFAILHLLVYPASNGYNSYMDRDETPIGGLAAPMQPTRQLFAVTVFMDCIAVVAALFIIGFLTVFIFQGALVFYLTYHSAHPRLSTDVPVVSCFIASLLIGALYPLTQVYQHQEDKRDGVTTISYLLGKKGTFLFSIIQFGLATFLLYRLFNNQGQLNQFFLYLLILLPVVLFFLYWMRSVWQNEEAASFKNSLRMNLVSTFCTTAFFITLIILNH
jgi:1,4-dihydroxy-2-naphthoate octaprenyltransferase